MWCVTELNDEYIERMEDLLELYTFPLKEDEPVICFDEKTYKLLEHKHPSAIQDMQPGKVKRVDYQYKQRQSVNIFTYFQLGVGNPELKVTERRQRKDFALVIKELAESFPTAKTIHLVFDNLNIHSKKSLTDTFGEDEGSQIWKRFTVHRTPKHASWLNQAELLISAFARQALAKDRIPSVERLTERLDAWKRANSDFKTKWKFAVLDARKTFNYTRNT